jgi:hypothetical protein
MPGLVDFDQTQSAPQLPGDLTAPISLDPNARVRAAELQAAQAAPLAAEAQPGVLGAAGPPQALQDARDVNAAPGEATMPPGVAASPDAISGPSPQAPNAISATPQPPEPTGDPQTDIQNNIAYGRQLQAHREELAGHQARISGAIAAVQSGQADRELATERERAAAQKVENEHNLQRREELRKAIDDRVADHAKAGLEAASWSGDKMTGGKIVALIAGALGQGFMNVAMVQSGHAPTAQNEALNAINSKMKMDYDRKQQNLANSSAALLEARYGFKDELDNQRAAQNDLDAQTASKYRLIAKEAESQMRRAGAGQAAIDQNVIVTDARAKAGAAEDAIQAREESTQVAREKAAAESKAAEAHWNQGERQIDATMQNQKANQSIARGHLTLAQQEEQRRKEEFAIRDAERREAAERKSKEDKGKATVGSVRQNAVLGNLAEAEKAVSDVKEGGVSETAIQRLQSNEENAAGARHTSESGVIGSLAMNAARAVGLTPRGRYDGIPEGEQRRITAAEQVITHLTEMQQGKNIETLEQYRDRYSPYVPGLSIAEVRRREKALPFLVAEQRAIQDPEGKGTARTAGLKAAEAAMGTKTKVVGGVTYRYVPDPDEADEPDVVP